jgi:hypothetical protein
MSFLFTVLPPKGWRENKIVDFIASAASKKNLSQRNFNNSIIYTINSNDKACHFTYSNGIISFTFSSVLAEETIRNTELGHTLLNDSAFQTIKRTASLSNDFNLFINYKFLNVLLKPALSTEAENTLSFITNYAGWTELDTRAKQNFFQLNGFTTSNDSTGNYLSLFNNENPGKPDLFRIIPSSAAWISHFFVSDIETYSSRFRGVFSNKEADDSIAFFNSMCGTSFQKKFFGECSGEFAAIINRPSMADFTSGTMAVFKLKHPKNTETILQETSDSLIKNSGSNLQAEKFSEFEIKPFPAGRIFNYLLGNVFTYSAVNYYVIIDNSVVFANNTDALAALINSYNTDKTISKDKDFISLSDNLASESNIFIYCNIPRSYPLFSAFAGESLIEALTLHHSIIKKMGVVSLQVSYTKNNLFYNNFILKHNAGYKEPEIQSGNKWSLTLDGNAFTKPASVINHNTGEQEIFVQDDGGNIYLIDNSGEILWKRKTEGQIMSDIHRQIAIIVQYASIHLFN